jgi:hypothetical protein
MNSGRSKETRADALKDNEWLTFVQRRAAVGPRLARRHDLNAFFANSVNSPSKSMVNFSSCVRSMPDVTREVTAQPMRSAVRMEAGVHAGV